MKTKNFIALVEIDKETGKCGVILPDFPGFSSVGNNYEDAIKNATEGLASHIEVLKEYKNHVPNPRSLKEIRTTWSDWNQWNEDVEEYIVTMIPVLPPYGTQKILVSIDSNLVARIDRVSKNRSAFFASAAEYFLDAKPSQK